MLGVVKMVLYFNTFSIFSFKNYFDGPLILIDLVRLHSMKAVIILLKFPHLFIL